MPTTTYDLIGTATATGSSPTLLVSGIPSTYTHLYLIANLRSSDSRTGGQSASLYFNNDTGGNYAKVGFSNGASFAQTNASAIELSCAMNGNTSGSFWQNEALIVQYKNTGMYKNVSIRSGTYDTGGNDVAIQFGHWRNTNAISSVYIGEPSNLNWVAGSQVSIYGIVG